MRFLNFVFPVLISQVGLAQSPSPHVDMLLVLAVDVSGSIAEPTPNHTEEGTATAVNEYLLQKHGIASALVDEDVIDVLEQCNYEGIGITYMEWSGSQSGEKRTKQVIPWTRIKNGSDMEAFAQMIYGAQRSSAEGTDIVAALDESLSLIKNAPFEAYRRVIDLSTDGKQNIFDRRRYMQEPTEEELRREIMRMRDIIAREGIALNALVIMDEDKPDSEGLPLDVYHMKSTYGGPGSLKVVKSFEDIKDAFKERFLRELNNCMM